MNRIFSLLFLFVSSAASAIGGDAIGVCELTGSPQVFDGKSVRVEGYIVLVRHGLFLVESRSRLCVAKINIPLQVEARDSKVRPFLKAVYSRPFKESWRNVKVLAVGNFDRREGEFPQNVISVDSILQFEVLVAPD